MTATDQRLRGRTRWSSTARCERLAFYGYIGVEPEPWDALSQRRMRRGKLDEQVVVEELRAKYGEENIRTQEAVLWPSEKTPLGELHPDAYIIPERVVVEIKSHAGGEPTESDWVQLAGQTYYHPEAESGLLIIVDRNLELSAYPLVLTDSWREEIEGRAAALLEAIGAGEPPARRCAHPGEGRGRFCPFIAHCFSGWQPTPAGDFPDQELALELYQADRARKAAKEGTTEAEERYEQAKTAVLDAGLAAGESNSGPFRLKRTVIADSPRFSLAKAEQAGHAAFFQHEPLSAFVKFSGGHDRLTIERISADAPEVDYGEEAPF